MKNINIEGIKKFKENAKQDRSLLFKNMKIEVKWNFDESIPQMTSKIEYPEGVSEIMIEQSPQMGGKGRAPNPVQFCLLGIASCFSATFATIANEEGLDIEQLIVSAENRINFSKILDLSEEPVVDRIFININIKTKSDKNLIEKVKELSLKKCPAVFCISNPVPVEVNITEK